MNRNSFILVALFCVGCKVNTAKVSAPEQIIKGQVLQTNLVCGGVPPSKSQLEEMNREKPYSKRLLVSTNKNSAAREFIVSEITPDSEGQFTLNLKQGEYFIFDPEKQDLVFKPEQFPDHKLSNKACYDKWISTPDASFKTGNTNSDVLRLVFHLPCFTTSANPCLDYIGHRPD